MKSEAAGGVAIEAASFARRTRRKQQRALLKLGVEELRVGAGGVRYTRSAKTDGSECPLVKGASPRWRTRWLAVRATRRRAHTLVGGKPSPAVAS